MGLKQMKLLLRPLTSKQAIFDFTVGAVLIVAVGLWITSIRGSHYLQGERGHATKLTVTLNTSLLSRGQYMIGVRRPPLDWTYNPITVD